MTALLFIMPLSVAAFSDNYTGMVWESHGNWYLNGSTTALRPGEAVPQGALLTADARDGAQSTVILLPDGQRLLCECYEAGPCSQGFRIPALTTPPSPGTWDMFVGVRNALLLRSATASVPSAPVGARAAMAANTEIVASPSKPGEISIASALSVLPSGRYLLTAEEDGSSSPQTPNSAQALTWIAPHGEATVRVAGPGVYRIRVADLSSIPRIQVEVLVTTPDAFPKELAALKQTRETVRQWSSTHPGWALHDFLRVYLQSRAISAVETR